MEASYNPVAANATSPDAPNAPLVHRWMGAINAAKKHRKTEFDDVADEARQFFDGERNFMWKDMEKQMSEQTGQGFLAGSQMLPQFKISINRMFDAVAMFGPSLYHQNPTIAVNPRSPLSISIDTFYATNPQATQLVRMIPAMQQGAIANPQIMQMAIQLQEQYEQAVTETELRKIVATDHSLILESLSNYYQKEGSKKDEARLAITEAIVTGLGLLEIVYDSPPGGGPRTPQSRFLSNRDLYVDPDACYWRDVQFIAIRRIAPTNVVERRFNLPPGYLKGKHASNTALAGKSPLSSDTKRHGDGKITGVAHDMVEYYDVYSKNGAGQRLKIGENDKQLEGLDSLGDYVYLAICPTCPKHPLNLPTMIPLADPVTGEASPEALEATAWPAPFWDDAATDGGWPITRLMFYQSPGKVWPISMAKPCLPEMRFVNWMMSFLADGVAVGSKIYPAVVKQAANSLREQLESGSGPFTILEIESISGKNINEIVTFLKAPAFNLDIYTMLERVNDRIDKALGLTELMYGMSGRQMRSAAEAQYRQSNVNIRPDDMASQVEDWLTVTAIREIQILRWNGSYEDVEPIIGTLAAQVFETQILTQDVSSITREFNFRVEAGTARKPNKDTRITQLSEIGQYLLPVTQQAMTMGVPKPWNAFIEDMARAMDMDPSRYMLSDQDQAQMLQFKMVSEQPPMPPEAEKPPKKESA
jgi:hypothetical protein